MIVPGEGFLLPSSRIPRVWMVMDEIDTCINENNRSNNGENSQCNTYDMGAEISVDKR